MAVQASPLTVAVLGRQKSVTVRGELLTVSLYPKFGFQTVLLTEGPIGGSEKVSL